MMLDAEIQAESFFFMKTMIDAKKLLFFRSTDDEIKTMSGLICYIYCTIIL